MIDDAAPPGWPIQLGHMVVAKQAIAEADPRRRESFAPPNVKATEAEIAAFEDGFGEPLPRSYRQFLSYANGWPHFYFGMDLFGLDELSGAGQGPTAKRLLDVYESEEVLADLGLAAADLLPVGAGRGMQHLVAIVRTGRPLAGHVTWMDGELARYPDFLAYFTEVTEMKQRVALRLQAPPS